MLPITANELRRPKSICVLQIIGRRLSKIRELSILVLISIQFCSSFTVSTFNLKKNGTAGKNIAARPPSQLIAPESAHSKQMSATYIPRSVLLSKIGVLCLGSSFHDREVEQNTKRRNKFASDLYDKPIVLIGCSGAGSELERIAAVHVASSSPKSSAEAAMNTLEELQGVEVISKRKQLSGIIRTTGTNSRGTWVLSYSDLYPKIRNKVIGKSSVIVIDYDSAAFNMEEGKYANKLTDHLTDLVRKLYEEENMLVVYINVHTDASGMSRMGKARKLLLEKRVFIEYSDYELCVKDEGLDTATVMTQKLLIDEENTFLSDIHAEFDPSKQSENVLPVDRFSQMLSVSTERQERILNAITEKQLSAWDGIEWLFNRLLARAFLPPAIPGAREPSVNSASLTMGRHTFFLSLSFPSIADAQPYVESMCQDIDAMEFRVDLLSCRDDRFDVLYSLQHLRIMCRPHAIRAPALPCLSRVIDDALPMVYTVRTDHQAGRYPDDEQGIRNMFDLLHLGLRSGVEVMDLESVWDMDKRNFLLDKVEDRYATQVLGSHHIVGKQVSTEEATEFFQRCSLNGRAHGAKVVLTIDDQALDHQAQDASTNANIIAKKCGIPVIPHIGLILGEIGQYSRVLNLLFTPVTHESLPFKAAPGQMSACEIMTTRLLMGLLKPKQFGILGHNISYSVSPAMHSAAFMATKLPHSYVIFDVGNVEDFVNSDVCSDDSFGGCSVTIPHKQSIIPFLDELTDAAKIIGAVNTVIVKEADRADGRMKKILTGDNTDWRGIYNPIKRFVKTDGETRTGIALILGGGGTARAAAYAASQLGLKRVYYNRSPSKVLDLADHFGGTVVLSLDAPVSHDPILRKFGMAAYSTIESNSPTLGSLLESLDSEIRVVISTLPASADFELPDWLLKRFKESEHLPVVFDVNYKPYYTKLLSQAETHGFPVIRGSEMLWEQGVGQFELWTERTAPYKIMKEVVLKNCVPKEDGED